MSLFRASPAAAKLAAAYPFGEILASILPALPASEQLGFIRQWLNEGIPFAFKDAPMTHERIRDWLAVRVGVSEKHITLTGSARLGISLAPAPKFGRNFDLKTSDLDFAIADGELFQKLANDARA